MLILRNIIKEIGDKTVLLNKNVELYEDYAELITVVAVRDAFHTMIGAASTLPKFNCYPKRKGATGLFQSR